MIKVKYLLIVDKYRTHAVEIVKGRYRIGVQHKFSATFPPLTQLAVQFVKTELVSRASV